MEKVFFENIMSISKNNDYTTGNLLDYEYFSKHYKLIAIDLSKQIELENPDLRQQINFIRKLENDKATMFFIIEKSDETTFEFCKILWVSYKMKTHVQQKLMLYLLMKQIIFNCNAKVQFDWIQP